MYFDWADHVAVEDVTEYPYHLNKTAQDVEKLSLIFEKTLVKAQFQQWRAQWYQQTVAAAWMHDIGMIKARERHNILSPLKMKLIFLFIFGTTEEPKQSCCLDWITIPLLFPLLSRYIR